VALGCVTKAANESDVRQLLSQLVQVFMQIYANLWLIFAQAIKRREDVTLLSAMLIALSHLQASLVAVRV
jgi:high-affinity K+ transport system ATPase subunit B